MKPIRTLGLWLLLLLFCIPATAQVNNPSTFLWRISGNKLTRPSYLYGTMHLQDRRLFYFGDSLYNALEKTEGFAMEINPDEMMDSLFKSMERKDTSALLRKILSDAEFKRLAKKLEKKLNMPADKITVKKLAEEKRKLQKPTVKKDDMPTIMDLYLFSLAKKMGKHTGGIEDLADQFGILDELGTFKIDDFLKQDSSEHQRYTEWMINTYSKRDLNAIHKLIDNEAKSEFQDILLVKRNIKMAARMDSLSGIRSSFFAVGAAHLPGDSGVITLLRQRGFTVDPVFSSAYIAPEEYKYSAKETPWIKIEDANKMCWVEMPGEPSSVNALEGLPMKMYIDLSEMKVYGVAVAALTSEDLKAEKIFDRIMKNYEKQNLEVTQVKDVEYQSAKGIEFVATQGKDYEFRARLLIRENKLFMVIFGAQQHSDLTGEDAERYLKSLAFNESNIVADKDHNWEVFTNSKNAFSVAMPGKVIEGFEPGEDGAMYDKYTSVDYSDGSYYMIMVIDTKPGYFIENDSSYFEDYKHNLEKLTKRDLKEFSMIDFKKSSACHFVAIQQLENKEFALEGYLIRRGNRTYLPMVAMAKEREGFPQVTRFFRSFTPLAYEKHPWKEQPIGETGLSTSVPGPFIKEVEDTTGYFFNKRTSKYHVQDKASAVSYSVEAEYFPSFYWSVSDSSFFRDAADGYKKYTDSMLSYSYTSHPFKRADFTLRSPRQAFHKKFSMILNGDTLYTFYNFQHEEILNDPGSRDFFSNIKILKPVPTNLFTSKAKELLKALQSSDSAVVGEARNSLEKVAFAKEDLPVLLDALIWNYPKNDNEYRTINDILADKAKAIRDSSVVDFVQKNYAGVSDSTDLPIILLELLAGDQTQRSAMLVKDLLLKKTPLKGSMFRLVNTLSDSLELLKDFFPAVTALYNDTICGPAMIEIGNMLLDSNLAGKTEVLQNENKIYEIAQWQYDMLRKDKDGYAAYNQELLSILGKLNTAKGNAWLAKFVALPAMWVKQNAIIELLRNKQPVANWEIRKFASNKEWRTGFYTSLKEINRTDLFPHEFYSQQKFAESYLYELVSSYYEVDIKTMKPVTEKTAEVNGKLKRYYIYRVVINDEEDKTERFAVCGAFDPDKAIAEVGEDDQDVFLNYDEAFSMSSVDEMFNKYIEEKKKNKNKE